jgi:hypothetical protein
MSGVTQRDATRGEGTAVADTPRSKRFFCFSRRSIPPDPSSIKDMRFTNPLARLVSLRDFLFTRGVSVEDADKPLLDFGGLNNLQYNEKGRQPTDEEWKQLNERSQRLFLYLDNVPGLRER